MGGQPFPLPTPQPDPEPQPEASVPLEQASPRPVEVKSEPEAVAVPVDPDADTVDDLSVVSDDPVADVMAGLDEVERAIEEVAAQRSESSVVVDSERKRAEDAEGARFRWEQYAKSVEAERDALRAGMANIKTRIAILKAKLREVGHA